MCCPHSIINERIIAICIYILYYLIIFLIYINHFLVKYVRCLHLQCWFCFGTVQICFGRFENVCYQVSQECLSASACSLVASVTIYQQHVQE